LACYVVWFANTFTSLLMCKSWPKNMSAMIEQMRITHLRLAWNSAMRNLSSTNTTPDLWKSVHLSHLACQLLCVRVEAQQELASQARGVAFVHLGAI
jgi:hypothetical protein